MTSARSYSRALVRCSPEALPRPRSRCMASLMLRDRVASVIRCGADHDAARAHVGRMDPDDARGRLRGNLRRLLEHMGHRAAGARAISPAAPGGLSKRQSCPLTALVGRRSGEEDPLQVWPLEGGHRHLWGPARSRQPCHAAAAVRLPAQTLPSSPTQLCAAADHASPLVSTVCVPGSLTGHLAASRARARG